MLRRELARPSWTREVRGLGTATDCYQPIEGHYKLTRRTLEALLEHGSPVGVVTKGPMIVRDKDLLAALRGDRRVQRGRQRAVQRRRGDARGWSLERRRRASGCARCASCSTPA